MEGEREGGREEEKGKYMMYIQELKVWSILTWFQLFDNDVQFLLVATAINNRFILGY